jgi:hypothetical protein
MQEYADDIQINLIKPTALVLLTLVIRAAMLMRVRQDAVAKLCLKGLVLEHRSRLGPVRAEECT